MRRSTSAPSSPSTAVVIFRLSTGVMIALVCGVIAGYYTTQGSSAAPVGLMVVEPLQAVTVAAPAALPTNPQQLVAHDSVAIIRAEQARRLPRNELNALPLPGPEPEAPAVVAEPAPVPAPAPVAVSKPRNSNTVSFNQRPLRKARTLRMLVTAYSPDARSCGKWADGVTASGYSVWTNGMKLVAADTKLLPFGTILTIPGYNRGRPVPVLDRGGAIKGHRLDLLFPTHEAALKWGKKWIDVQVWEYAD